MSEENVFFFGHLTPEVPALQRAHVAESSTYPDELMEAVDAIRDGLFGEAGVFEPLLATLFEGKDFCEFFVRHGGVLRLIKLSSDLVSDDFVSCRSSFLPSPVSSSILMECTTQISTR